MADCRYKYQDHLESNINYTAKSTQPVYAFGDWARDLRTLEWKNNNEKTDIITIPNGKDRDACLFILQAEENSLYLQAMNCEPIHFPAHGYIFNLWVEADMRPKVARYHINI